MDVELVGRILDRGAGQGSGRRGLRGWQRAAPCCAHPGLVVGPDGRMSCPDCGCWYSASHSLDRLVLARSAGPVGVDVQYRCRRPRALRALGRATGVAAPRIEHWALAEAALKAAGLATRFPDPGVLILPQAIAEGGDLPVIAGASGSIALTGWPVRVDGAELEYAVFRWGRGFTVVLAAQP